jgi:hypothetical protein
MFCDTTRQVVPELPLDEWRSRTLALRLTREVEHLSNSGQGSYRAYLAVPFFGGGPLILQSAAHTYLSRLNVSLLWTVKSGINFRFPLPYCKLFLTVKLNLQLSSQRLELIR